MKKGLFFLLIVLSFTGCEYGYTISHYDIFKYVPKWAREKTVFNEEGSAGWLISEESIEYIEGGVILETFTPRDAFTVKMGNYCFILVTEFLTVCFELIDGEIEIESYYDL